MYSSEKGGPAWVLCERQRAWKEGWGTHAHLPMVFKWTCSNERHCCVVVVDRGFVVPPVFLESTIFTDFCAGVLASYFVFVLLVFWQAVRFLTSCHLVHFWRMDVQYVFCLQCIGMQYVFWRLGVQTFVWRLDLQTFFLRLDVQTFVWRLDVQYVFLTSWRTNVFWRLDVQYVFWCAVVDVQFSPVASTTFSVGMCVLIYFVYVFWCFTWQYFVCVCVCLMYVCMFCRCCLVLHCGSRVCPWFTSLVLVAGKCPCSVLSHARIFACTSLFFACTSSVVF